MKMQTIDLSIIILSFNQEKYIERAIKSILFQDTNVSFELIIGDDASSDKTPLIIEEYRKKYPDIIKAVLRKKNIGVVANYFDLISLCEGKFVMECAGDDYWMEDKIERQIDYMLKNPNCSLLCSATQVIDEKGNNLKILRSKKGNYSFNKLLEYNSVFSPTACYKLEDINRYICAVNPISKNWKMEDYPFILWSSIHGEINYLDEILGCYQVSAGSISHPISIQRQINFENEVSRIRFFFARNRKEERNAQKIYNNNIAHIYITNHQIKKYLSYSFKNMSVCNLIKIPYKVFKYGFLRS